MTVSGQRLAGGDIEFIERLVGARTSCRAFRADPVHQELIERMFTIAQRAASWCNVQPWQVVVTSGEATRGLSDVLLAGLRDGGRNWDIEPPQEYQGDYLARRRTSGFGLYDRLGVARDDREARAAQVARNYSFFGAPHVAVITSEASLGPYALVDCGGYVANLMLAATSLGIASIPQAAIAGWSAEVRQHLGIGDHRSVICAVSFGYADQTDPVNTFRTERASVEDVVRWVS